jgi:hypothetical protein
LIQTNLPHLFFFIFKKVVLLCARLSYGLFGLRSRGSQNDNGSQLQIFLLLIPVRFIGNHERKTAQIVFGELLQADDFLEDVP